MNFDENFKFFIGSCMKKFTPFVAEILTRVSFIFSFEFLVFLEKIKCSFVSLLEAYLCNIPFDGSKQGGVNKI